MTYINLSDFSSSRKWELLQFCISPSTQKASLIKLLLWWNSNIFESIQPKILKQMEKSVSNLKRKISQYGEEYLRLLMKFDYRNDPTDRRVVFYISYFLEVGFLMMLQKEVSEDLYYFGYRFDDVFVDRKHRIMGNVHLFKALGDETRLNLLQALAKKDHYGEELSQMLNLTNSTISYHLSLLLYEGLVNIKRIENKTYFSLNYDLFRSRIKKAVDQLLDQDQ